MQYLRPVERRILAMRDDGLGITEIASKLKRSPAHVERMIAWTEIPRSGPPPRRSPRPIERRVMALRSDGESHERIGRRFVRSPGFIRRVEGLAHYTKARHLLHPDAAGG